MLPHITNEQPAKEIIIAAVDGSIFLRLRIHSLILNLDLHYFYRVNYFLGINLPLRHIDKKES